MSRTKNAFNGFVADIVGQILSQGLGFVAIPIYLHYTSNANFGYWLTIGSIMTWIAISDLGIGMALGRLLIKIKTEEDRGDREVEILKLLNTSFLIFLLSAALFFLVGCFAFPFITKWFSIAATDLPIFRITYFISLLAGALSFPLSVFGGILESSQKIALNRNINTLGTIVNTVAAVLLVMYFRNIIGLSIALLFSVLVKAIISFYHSNKQTRIVFRLKLFNKLYARELFSFGGYFQIARVANTVAVNTDNLFITSYMGAGFVPQYNFSSKLSQLFGVVIASKIPAALFVGLSQLVDQNDYERLRYIFNIMMKLLLRLALMMATFTLFYNRDFVTLWVGEKEYSGNLLNFVFVYWILFETIVRGTTGIIYALREMKGWAYACLAEAAVNVLLSIILVKYFGLFGIAIATAIARTFTTGLYLGYVFVKKGILTRATLTAIYPVIIKFIPTFIFFFTVNALLRNGIFSWGGIILIGTGGLIINVLCYEGKIIFDRKNKSITEIFKRIVASNL